VAGEWGKAMIGMDQASRTEEEAKQMETEASRMEQQAEGWAEVVLMVKPVYVG